MIKQSKPKTNSRARSTKTNQLVRKDKSPSRTSSKKVSLPRARSASKKSK